MSGFLERMASRALDLAPALSPRPLSLFEPAPEDLAPASFTPPAQPPAPARPPAMAPRPAAAASPVGALDQPAKIPRLAEQPSPANEPVAVRPSGAPSVVRASPDLSAASVETDRGEAPPANAHPVRRREAAPAAAAMPVHPLPSVETGSTQEPPSGVIAVPQPAALPPTAGRGLIPPFPAASPGPVFANPPPQDAEARLPIQEPSTTDRAASVAAAPEPERTAPAAGPVAMPPVRIEATPVLRTGADPFHPGVADRGSPAAIAHPPVIEIHIAKIEIHATPPDPAAAAPAPFSPSLDAFLERRRER